MSWFTDTYEKLFKREVDPAEFEAIFRRMDLEQFFGNLNNLWHPSELIRKIGGWDKLDLLYKDPDIYASIDKRIAALKSTKMVLKGKNESITQFMMDQLKPHELQLKEDIWWTIFNGYGVEQIIYNEDLSGRVVGFQREEFWRFEPQKDLIHVKCVDTSVAALRNKILPYGKWVLTTNNGTSYNPMGDSMGERLVMPWIFKCNGADLWMDFAKRFANGFMHGKITDMKKKDEFRRALEKAGKSSVIVTDKDSELSMIQASRDSSIYTSINDQTVRSITKVILGETQTSDMQERGSSASAAIHNDVRIEKTMADIELVQKGIKEIMLHIAAVNGFEPDDVPDVAIIYDTTYSESDLYAVGVRFNKEYFMNKYGLKETEFDVPVQSGGFGFSPRQGKSTFLTPAQMAAFIGGLPGKSCPVHGLTKAEDEAAAKRKATRSENENEEIVAVLNRTASPPLDPDDLISAILTSQNEKELDDKLNALFDTRNNAFVDDLTEALYYAATRGAMLGNPEPLE